MRCLNTIIHLLSIVVLSLFWSCGGNSGSGIDNGFRLSDKVSAVRLKEGRNLAEIRCRSCHAFPDPNQLDKESWERYVLPTMGYRMGLYHQKDSKNASIRNSLIETGLAGELVLQANIFPEKPLISKTEFQKITDYYLTAAPARALPPAAKPTILPDLNIFKRL